VGCAPATAKVSGQVLYKDQPVRGGWVMFAPAEAGVPIARAAIDEEGRYELTARVGDVLILVDNRELAPGEKPPPPELPGDIKLPPEVKAENPPRKSGPGKASPRYVEIPPKYYQFETSGLKYTVKPESQTYNIELKPSGQ
jgi:hypothetical protein